MYKYTRVQLICICRLYNQRNLMHICGEYVCLIVCFPSFEERQCSTFHKGTESLPKQKLKPGGHGSACSVNRSS